MLMKSNKMHPIFYRPMDQLQPLIVLEDLRPHKMEVLPASSLPLAQPEGPEMTQLMDGKL